MQVFMDADNDGNGTLSKEEFEKASIGSGPVGCMGHDGGFCGNFHGATPLEWAGEASHVFSVGPHHL